MKRKSIIMMMLAFACIVLVSCKQKTQEVPYVEPVLEDEIYEPIATWKVVDYTSTTYNYYNAPCNIAADCVEVVYDGYDIYACPIEIEYIYQNGDTYTYILEDFGIWQNSEGSYRIIVDDECTVWVQGQTAAGKFYEFVFYGDPRYNGMKISPNSYRNLPAGEIKYRK